MKRIAVLILIALVVTPLALAGGRKAMKRGDTPGMAGIVAGLPVEEIDENEEADLTFLREEEKLARDVYLAMREEWGLRVFRNISRSEETHMAAVLALLEKYEIEDPVGENEEGVFTNADLQDLYDALVEQGMESEIAALTVGATIEDMDIADLKEMLERTDNQDLGIVYQNLMKGSRNHLRAFVKVLTRKGETYEPQYLSQEEFDEIIDTPKERHRVDESGEPVGAGERHQGRGREPRQGRHGHR